MSLTAVITWLNNGCDPLEAAKELEYHNKRFADLEAENAELKQQLLEHDAKLAMQAEVLTTANNATKLYEGHDGQFSDVLNTTQSDVDDWIAEHDKKLLDEAFGDPVGYWLPCEDVEGSIIRGLKHKNYEPLYRRKESA